MPRRTPFIGASGMSRIRSVFAKCSSRNEPVLPARRCRTSVALAINTAACRANRNAAPSRYSRCATHETSEPFPLLESRHGLFERPESSQGFSQADLLEGGLRPAHLGHRMVVETNGGLPFNETRRLALGNSRNGQHLPRRGVSRSGSSAPKAADRLYKNLSSSAT